MAQKDGIYKCEVCGNIAEVLIDGGAPLVCCGKEMVLFDEKTQDQGKEKHVPVSEIEGNNITVKVGDMPHPMQDEHYIHQIELIKDGDVIASKRLKPRDEPKAVFCLDDISDVKARIFCNVHGVWKS